MAQQEMFEASKADKLKRRVKELDAEISRAMRKKDFTQAKGLTDQQSTLLQELIGLGEPGKP